MDSGNTDKNEFIIHYVISTSFTPRLYRMSVDSNYPSLCQQSVETEGQQVRYAIATRVASRSNRMSTDNLCICRKSLRGPRKNAN